MSLCFRANTQNHREHQCTDYQHQDHIGSCGDVLVQVAQSQQDAYWDDEENQHQHDHDYEHCYIDSTFAKSECAI